MPTYTGIVIVDEEGPILIFPEDLSRELNWPVGTKVRINGNSNCFTIEPVMKARGRRSGKR